MADQTSSRTLHDPLPPGFPPHPPHAEDGVFYFRSDEAEAAGGKEHEDIMLRRVPREVAMRFRARRAVER